MTTTPEEKCCDKCYSTYTTDDYPDHQTLDACINRSCECHTPEGKTPCNGFGFELRYPNGLPDTTEIEEVMKKGIKQIAGRVEALHPQYFLDEATYKHDVKGTMDVVKMVMADIEETHHQQLQKSLLSQQQKHREELQKEREQILNITAQAIEENTTFYEQKYGGNYEQCGRDIKFSIAQAIDQAELKGGLLNNK